MQARGRGPTLGPRVVRAKMKSCRMMDSKRSEIRGCVLSRFLIHTVFTAGSRTFRKAMCLFIPETS
jgi:hypothetical protein